jgi:hypothetical protein
LFVEGESASPTTMANPAKPIQTNGSHLELYVSRGVDAEELFQNAVPIL